MFGNSLKDNVSLKEYTTFKIGGPAKYFFIAESEEDITKAVNVAKEFGLDYFVLGGGSNVLVSDKGFNGLIIKIQNSNVEIPALPAGRQGMPAGRQTWRNNFIKSGSGILLSKLISLATKNCLSGLEYFVGIPGTLGGAIFGNAGIQNHAIGDIVKSVKILWPNGKIEEKNQEWMEFDYRTSKIKKMPTNERPIILSAILELKIANPKEIKKIMNELTMQREQKIPKEPSAGCIFKNPKNNNLTAGQIIDSLGLKGKCVGGACVSNLHANFIINKNRATAKDVRELIDLIKETVKREKGIELEEEICYLGF